MICVGYTCFTFDFFVMITNTCTVIDNAFCHSSIDTNSEYMYEATKNVCVFPMTCLKILGSVDWIFMPPLKKEGHIALHLSVGRYVGIPYPCATDNSRTLCPRSFKLGR